MKHILSVDQFDLDFINKLFQEASNAEKFGFYNTLRNKIVANLFYEPSTRTSCSFHSATIRLGGQVISINDVNYSSISKGENLEDTIRTMNCYSDLIVLRSKHEGDAERAAEVSEVSIINAGDGKGEHPTQALLDLYTIYQTHGSPNGLKVGFVGDLKFGRTVHSLSKLLNLYDVEKFFFAPTEFQFPDELATSKDLMLHTTDLKDYIPKLDVLYVTRLQVERHPYARDYAYVIDKHFVKNSKPTLSILHPLPRVNELSTDLDDDPRAHYFKQMKNGLYVRAALLDYLVKNN